MAINIELNRYYAFIDIAVDFYWSLYEFAQQKL